MNTKPLEKHRSSRNKIPTNRKTSGRKKEKQDQLHKVKLSSPKCLLKPAATLVNTVSHHLRQVRKASLIPDMMPSQMSLLRPHSHYTIVAKIQQNLIIKKN